MDVYEAIFTRRSIVKFKPEPVAHDLLFRILSTGIWAPNHHLTEPWRFTVLGKETQGRLALRYGELRMDKAPPEAPLRRERLREAGIQKFLDIPTVIAVSTVQEGDEQRRREDYAATCCAMQNIQLAAWAEGVGMKWSTSALTRDALTFELLGLEPTEEYIVGFLYTGYPAEIPTLGRRRSPEEVIRWTP
jgi:nitroreductase